MSMQATYTYFFTPQNKKGSEQIVDVTLRYVNLSMMNYYTGPPSPHEFHRTFPPKKLPIYFSIFFISSETNLDDLLPILYSTTHWGRIFYFEVAFKYLFPCSFRIFFKNYKIYIKKKFVRSHTDKK